MAEPLKNHFDRRVPERLATQLAAVWPAFDSTAFLRDVVDGYDALELMDRGRHIARVLHRHLPSSYPEALRLLLQSIDAGAAPGGDTGPMASFRFLPHVSFVAQFGLDHFDESMRALHLLTQRFTAEFSIRPFIERYQNESLALLRRWALDPSEHVRRLVSEGTRPRLPWAGRLRNFQRNPAPVLELIELLRDDPALYVRRSVANNLNDIGKDHPEVLVDVARRWYADGGNERRALVRHALRSLVKQGHPDALDILGFGGRASVTVDDVAITPKRVKRGGRVSMVFSVRSTARRAQRVLVDLRVHYIKANGSASPKVFKLRAIELAPRAHAEFRKTLSLADLTTRKHHAGRHQVDVLVNGVVHPLGEFVLGS